MLADRRESDGNGHLHSYFPVFAEQQAQQEQPGANAQDILFFDASVRVAQQTDGYANKSQCRDKVIAFSMRKITIFLRKMP